MKQKIKDIPLIIDCKKSKCHLLTWRKCKSWNLETTNTTVSKYRVYGGVTSSGSKSKPHEAWYFSGKNDATTSKKFDNLDDAMTFVEDNFDRKFFV